MVKIVFKIFGANKDDLGGGKKKRWAVPNLWELQSKIKGTMKIHRLEGFDDKNQVRTVRYPPLRGASNHAHHDIYFQNIMNYCFPLLHPLIKVLQIRLSQFV